MLIRLMDLIAIGDGTGEEYDIGELVTYLNDAVLICPTMLLVPAISWAAVDGTSFDISLTDHGRRVTARVFVGADGAPTEFSTTDRFCYNPDEPKTLLRARWTTPVEGGRRSTEERSHSRPGRMASSFRTIYLCGFHARSTVAGIQCAAGRSMKRAHNGGPVAYVFTTVSHRRTRL